MCVSPTISDQGATTIADMSAPKGLAGAILAAFAVQIISSSPAVAGDVTTLRVSVNMSRDDSDGDSFYPDVSGNGQYVVFESSATDLVPGDGNSRGDIFRRDMRTDATVRVSVDVDGGDPNKQSYFAKISADGRYVVFESDASDLVAGDENRGTDIFVRDMVAGTTVRASVDVDGANSNGSSGFPVISADGRYVAFNSDADDLVADDRNELTDVFVRDLLTGTTVRASMDPSGGDPNGRSLRPDLSPDGRYVAYDSEASDLVEGDGNGVFDVYLRDLVAGTTARVSVDLAGGDPDGASTGGDVSADGKYVGFSSEASDVVHGDGNTFTDSFVRDMFARTTVRASVDRGGGDPEDDVYLISITPDGRYVTLYSYADDLIRGDHKAYDVFVRDLQALTTIRATVSRTGHDPNGGCFGGSISDSGRFVVFETVAQNMVRKDWNELQDIFYRDMSRLPPDPG